jgi:methanogenic corrinoid protein MtbC1
MDAQRDQLTSYLGKALAGEARQGTRLAMGLVDAGSSVRDVITGVLAETQRRVGEQWHLNRCSVADEHLATAVTTSALEAISDHREPGAVVGRVAVACAEGDWHSLPARMFCELLRTHGWDVWFLGASTPADDLGSMLARRRPDAFVVSCAVPASFLGVQRLVGAAHGQGVPVLVGGRAFGGDGVRAERLGADGWALDVDGASEILAGWLEAPPAPAMVVPPPRSVEQLSRASRRLAELCVRSLVEDGVLDDGDEQELSRLRHDLSFATEFLAAALLVGDDAVFTDFVLWLDAHHAARDISAAVLTHSLAALRSHILEVDTAGATLLETAAAMVGEGRRKLPPLAVA